MFSAAIAGASTTPDSTAKYQELVKKVTNGDFSIDFRELRLACADASNCDPRGDDYDLTAMNRALREKRYDYALNLANRLIATGFPNIEAHAVCANVYTALNKPGEAAFHTRVTTALLRSILSTGDGKTKETAFEVIGTHEERIVMTLLGLSPLADQALIPGKPHSYDVLTSVNPKTREKVSVYFNIDAFYPMKGLR